METQYTNKNIQAVKIFAAIIGGLFALSVLGSMMSKNSFGGVLVSGWILAVFGGVIVSVILLFVGVVGAFRKDKNQAILIPIAFMFLIGVAVVGGGTCVLNMSLGQSF